MQWILKGMNRDLSVSKFNKEFSFENRNIRFVTNDGNTTLSMTSERGPEECIIYIEGSMNNDTLEFEGVPIGYCVINSYLVLFFTRNNADSIYRLNLSGSRFVGKRIFRGRIGLSTQYPIETIGFYENENVQKVYWTDGHNQLRMINIMDMYNDSGINPSSDLFDFVQDMSFGHSIEITKNELSNGEFASGTVQYCLTYVNRYGQQSNIFHTSPLYYCASSDNGVSPEGKSSCSFTFVMSDLDSSFDYVRIYSIHRGSENSTPSCKHVADIEISAAGYVRYTDSNLDGDFIDPTELLFVGGEKIVAETFTHKDNVLFIGGIKTFDNNVPETLKVLLKTQYTNFVDNHNIHIEEADVNGYYFHKNQLSNPSDNIKGFKAGEKYRFGVQFQSADGKWSDTAWLGDYKIQSRPVTNVPQNLYGHMSYDLPTISLTLSDQSILSQILQKGYVKARPVVVFPKMNERECVCQGILCPTVYNVADRDTNSPFVQASWYPRPDSPVHLDYGNSNIVDVISNSSDGYLENNNSDRHITTDRSRFGKWAEFRHNSSLSSCSESNAEIQCSYSQDNDRISLPVDTSSDHEGWISKHNTDYFVDKSIVTMHSPDFEFSPEVWSKDMDNLQLRIVGKVPITANVSDIDILTSTGPRSGSVFKGYGFYKENVEIRHGAKSIYGWRGAMAMPYWHDQSSGLQGSGTDNPDLQAFVVYPWHRYGSLNDDVPGDNRSAMIKRKVISNMRVSAFTSYFSDLWSWYPPKGISGVTMFDSNEKTLSRIKSPENSGLPDLNYYGNVDKLLNNVNGYPIMISKVDNLHYTSPKHLAYAYSWRGFGQHTLNENGQECAYYSFNNWGYDPVRMKYKSTQHAVIAFNYDNTNAIHEQIVLPTSKDSYNVRIETPQTTYDPYWYDYYDEYTRSGFPMFTVRQDVIDRSETNIPYGYLWLGELYNPSNVDNPGKFGGTSEEALALNEWLVAGKSVDVDPNGFTLDWTEGDTYYQRYDHIKTYPFTQDDYQSLVEIVSFMCETRVNLDGRYDKNRGLASNLHITPENFNKINMAYVQTNNFFMYHYINSRLVNPTEYPNTILWTLQKISGSLVDEWTHITFGASMELEGDKGKVRALRKFTDKIIAFQDSAVSQILYNENVQIATTDGVPVELGNSGKVQGKRYLSTSQGCINKWSICESPTSLYFIDSLNKDICRINDGIQSLSKTLGFNSWSNLNIDNSLWTSNSFNAFVSYYDALNNEILYIGKYTCLAFSEMMGTFTSFYDYESSPYLINVQSVPFWIRESGSQEKEGYRLWKHNAGEYNTFFDVRKPYSVTLVANDNPSIDKTFTNLEFRADVVDPLSSLQDSKPFSFIDVWNEYQTASEELSEVTGRPSNLKRKFRTWRLNIPRHTYTTQGGIVKMDRIRNPWTYIKLQSSLDISDKTEIHDIVCDYLI